MKKSRPSNGQPPLRVLTVLDQPISRQRFVWDAVAELRRQGVAVKLLYTGTVAKNELSEHVLHHSLRDQPPNWRHILLFPFLKMALAAAELVCPRLARCVDEAADWPHMGKMMGTVRSLSFMKAALSSLRYRPHCLHVHFAWNLTDVMPLARLFKLPVVVTVHGSDVLISTIWKSALLDSQVRTIVCVSRYLKERVDMHSPIIAAKTKVLYNPINLSFLDDPAPSPASLNIVCVATLRRLKNHDWLLRSLRIMKLRGIEFRCHLVGGTLPQEDSEYRRLSSKTRLFGLGDRVRFRGWCEPASVKAELDGASVFVLPSQSEGFGMSIVEALARQRPAVVSDIPGAREATGDGRFGICVPLGDDEALASSLLYAHAISRGGHHMLAAGRAFAVDHFSPCHHADSLLKIIRSSLSDKATRS
jgi:glycosyltransferase involved in cell wall biosynthesis